MESIYGMLPINKTAARVTSQSGCESELTPEQARENLKAILFDLQIKRKAAIKGSAEYKRIGQEILNITLKMSEIRKKRKAPGVEQYFIGVAKENLTNFEFRRWMGIAADRMRSEQNNEK